MGWGALKSKLHEHALYANQSKTTGTCNSSLLLTKLNYINFNSNKTIFITN